MNTSEKVDQVLPALVAFQVALTNPTKDARAKIEKKGGGSFSYTYLQLPALLEHIAPARREAGLAIVQEVHGDPQLEAVTTYLIHLSGQWVSFGPGVMPAPQDAQQRGAVISYLRRYTLLAALGLAAEDDDASSASSSPARSHPAPAGSGGDGDAGRGAGEADDGEAPADPAPQTPSAQPAGHHDHVWAPSPTLNGWNYCTVKGCGKAEKARANA